MSDETSAPVSSGSSFSLTLKKQIWTLLIQGDLDKNGELFNDVVQAYVRFSEDISSGYKFYNQNNLFRGTHLKMTIIALTFSTGPVLELGPSELSKKLFEDVIDESAEDRKIISAYAGYNDFEGQTDDDNHQMLQVPTKCKGIFI